ncbi:MAG: alpha/beta hydrolase, partial [Thermoproteota archaeon]
MRTSKNARKNLPARIPRISTRGYYDLVTGRTLKKKPYDLYPKKFFEKELGNHPEFTIVVHGMRNNKQGALEKFKIVQKRLRQLGYKYPVIGFSYDSNVKGVQYKSCEHKATKVARLIAKKNGLNLAKFILNFKRKNPTMGIRLMGHSLGTEVITYALFCIYGKQKIDQVYFFGSSLPAGFLIS